MKKKIVVIALLVVFFTGVFGTAYADTSDTSAGAVMITEVKQKEIGDSAGVLPDSHFYQLERKLEQLKLAITKSEEKLAVLKAKYANERACEAVIMTNKGKVEFANQATAEYIKLLASATKHINTAIEVKEETVQIIEVLNESHKTSEEMIKIVLDKTPVDSKTAIESTLAEQDKALVAVNEFHAAKEAFFQAKEQFKQAKQELKVAKKSGDAEAIKIAADKVKQAESLKDELESKKDAAEFSKEQVECLFRQAEKGIKLGMDQIEKANKEMDKVKEKAEKEQAKLDKAMMKAEQKVEKTQEKAREKAHKFHEED
jgi:chromosome segregation ATPase